MMLSSLARKTMLMTAVVAGSLLVNTRDVQAFGHRASRHHAAATSCYAPCYTPSNNGNSCCVDQCVVYRWDWCCHNWVVDSVYPAYDGNLWWAEQQAWWRVRQLQWCGISAYSRCFVARADVYWYNPWLCRWELYASRQTPHQAAWEVSRLQWSGFCAYSTCYLVPVYTQQAAPSGQASPTSQAPAAPASQQAPKD